MAENTTSCFFIENIWHVVRQFVLVGAADLDDFVQFSGFEDLADDGGNPVLFKIICSLMVRILRLTNFSQRILMAILNLPIHLQLHLQHD